MHNKQLYVRIRNAIVFIPTFNAQLFFLCFSSVTGNIILAGNNIFSVLQNIDWQQRPSKNIKYCRSALVETFSSGSRERGRYLVPVSSRLCLMNGNVAAAARLTRRREAFTLRTTAALSLTLPSCSSTFDYLPHEYQFVIITVVCVCVFTCVAGSAVSGWQ